ncbi:MAG: Uma2 family endonuclease [Deltaproteobacteria bacterium]|nr:Uma2 family endonuclease [Deltaproteobacteria bacterium]
MGAAQRLLTYDELYAQIAALPEGRHGEILGPGWMRPVGRPGSRASHAAMRVLRRLDAFSIDEGGNWWLGREIEVRLPGDKLYVPTLVGWRVGGAPLDFLDENPVPRVPDWACEVLSRDIQKPDRAIKLPTYAAVGVAHTWVFDVEAVSIEVWEARDGLPALVAAAVGDAEVALPPFDLPFSPAKLLALAR